MIQFGDTRLPERFWSKIQIAPNGCWLWTRGLSSRGYAGYKLNGKQCVGHKVAYEALVGPVPDGFTLDHVVCDTRRCVHPEHVEAVIDAVNKQRGGPTCGQRRTRCRRNHQFIPENVYMWKGKPYCRECRRENRGAAA